MILYVQKDKVHHITDEQWLDARLKDEHSRPLTQFFVISEQFRLQSSNGNMSIANPCFGWASVQLRLDCLQDQVKNNK
jgi:hypothetical protein